MAAQDRTRRLPWLWLQQHPNRLKQPALRKHLLRGGGWQCTGFHGANLDTAKTCCTVRGSGQQSGLSERHYALRKPAISNVNWLSFCSPALVECLELAWLISEELLKVSGFLVENAETVGPSKRQELVKRPVVQGGNHFRCD